MHSTRLEAITRSRSLNDIRDVLSAISCDVLSAARVVGRFKSISAEEIVMDSREEGKSQRARVKSTKFVPPKASELKKHSAILNKLHDNCKELEASLVFIKQAFSGNKKLPAVVASITDLLNSANESLAETFKVMGDLAEKHLPSAVQAMLDNITGYLSTTFLKNKLASDIGLETYVIVDPKDAKAFQFCCYLGLTDLKDSSGYTFKEYYFVLTSKVTADGEYTFALNCFPDFKIPGSYPLGKEISTTQDAQKRLDFLVGHNNFRIVHEQQTLHEHKAGATAKNIAQLASVDNVSVKNDEIAVRLKPTVKTKAGIDKALTDIMALLNMLVKKSRTSRFVYRTIKSSDRVVFSFRLVGDDDKKDTPASINVSKLNEVSEALGLTDAQVKALRFAFQH